MQGRVGFANHGRFMRTLGGDMEKKMLTVSVLHILDYAFITAKLNSC